MLDQQQSVTVSAVERDYNLITFDKMQTKRVAPLADGVSEMTIDHEPNKATGTRHLVKVTDVIEATETTPADDVQVHIVIRCKDNATRKSRAVAIFTGLTNHLLADSGAILNRVLTSES